MSCNIEKILFNDSLNTAREKINKVYTGSTEIWSGGTGSQSIVSRGDDTNIANATRSVVAGGVSNTIEFSSPVSNTSSAIIGGENNIISEGGYNSVILGGANNKIEGAFNSVIVAGDGITAETKDTAYVETLNTSGHRSRNMRFFENEQYSYANVGKLPNIADNDDIILVDDQTPMSLPYGLDIVNDYTLGINTVINQNEVGRVVHFFLEKNGDGVTTGNFSRNSIGVVLLNTSDGSDFKVNNWQRSVRVAVGDPGFYPLFLSPNPSTPGFVAKIGQSASLMYMGRNDSNIPEFVAWGTGIWLYV